MLDKLAQNAPSQSEARKPDKLSQGVHIADKLSQSSMGEYPRVNGKPQTPGVRSKQSIDESTN